MFIVFVINRFITKAVKIRGSARRCNALPPQAATPEPVLKICLNLYKKTVFIRPKKVSRSKSSLRQAALGVVTRILRLRLKDKHAKHLLAQLVEV